MKEQPESADNPKMDPADLWREENFTDRRIGTIRCFTPVKLDGSRDPARKPAFIGEASLMTPAGALPLSFEIPASDLAGAVAGYGDALQKGLAEAMEEIKELRRRASSQIVIPGQAGGGLGPGLGGPGLGGPGLPPGKLKL